MKKITLLFIIIHCVVLGFSQKPEDITKVMDYQVEKWNQGDIDGFMETYWKSPELKFVGSNGVTKGWQATLERYHKSYPDRATMGVLKFDIQEIDFLSKKSAWVLGKWQLTREEKGDIGGYFTLILKRINKNWVIVSDHTS